MPTFYKWKYVPFLSRPLTPCLPPLSVVFQFQMWLSPASGNRIVWSVTGELLSPGDSDVNFRQSEFGPEAVDAVCGLIQDLKTPFGDTLGDLIGQSQRDNITKVMIEEKHYKTWFYGRTALIGEGKRVTCFRRDMEETCVRSKLTVLYLFFLSFHGQHNSVPQGIVNIYNPNHISIQATNAYILFHSKL